MAQRRKVIDIKIKKTKDEATPHLNAMERRAIKGFKSQFKWATRLLKQDIRKDFSTSGGGKWAALEKETVAWKLDEYGARGILVASGDLRKSLTVDNARGAVRKYDSHKMQFGTDLRDVANNRNVVYPAFIQYGTSNMEARKFLFDFGDPYGKRFSRKLGYAINERIIYGGTVGKHYTWLKKTGLRGADTPGWIRTYSGSVLKGQ